MKRDLSLLFCVALLFTCFRAGAGDLYVGRAVADITPKLPVSLDGQMYLRVASQLETPVEADVVVLEVKEGNRVAATSIWVTCDIVTIPTELRDMIRASIRSKVPGLSPEQLIVNASHTHTGGVVRANWYHEPDSITKVVEYQKFIAERVGSAVKSAWESRAPGTVSWGLTHAKVSYNRRAVYADGSARMYGKTDEDGFRKIEGYEDQSVHTLFFHDKGGNLIATCINVASPAQVVEGRSVVNGDYWYPVRQRLRQKHGQGLAVLGWIAAAGDQTPRPMMEQAAEARMLALRYKTEHGKTFTTDVYLQEIARRIVNAVEDAYEVVKFDQRSQVSLIHKVENYSLPMRLVTEQEYQEAKAARDKDLASPNKLDVKRRIAWQQEVVDRYENQKTTAQPMYPVEIHVVRLGDISVATNPFELFTEYGTQIKAKSKSLQTFVIQLVGPGTYLPTREAEKGGHYSAIVQSVRVGPDGGQILVDKTVRSINELWP